MSRLDKCPECDCDEIDTSDDVWFCLGCGVNIGVLDDYMFKVGSLETELRRLREVEARAKAYIEALGNYIDPKSPAWGSVTAHAKQKDAVLALRSALEARDGEKT